MIETPILPTLHGSAKQREWAEKIVAYFQAVANMTYDSSLPRVTSASWWIDHRDDTLDQIRLEATVYTPKLSTPFTSQYPRYTRHDALAALSQLNNTLILDTETSGLLKSKRSEIVELSLVHLQTQEVLFNSLVKPFYFDCYGDKASEAAIAIHKITREELELAPTLQDLWPTLEPLLTSHQLVSYNAAFDFPMISKSARLWGIHSLPLSGTCVMKIFSAYKNTDEWYKLSEACHIMGIDQELFGDAHRSMADTLATVELLRSMREES